MQEEALGMKWTEIVTAIVALYAALLTTYQLIVNRIENKLKVKVGISVGFIHIPMPQQTSEPMIFLKAINIGKKTVNLGSFSFVLPDNEQLYLLAPHTNVTFPFALSPGKSCQVWYEMYEVVKTLKESGYSKKIKIIGKFKDEADTVFKSKPYTLNINDWIKKHRQNNI